MIDELYVSHAPYDIEFVTVRPEAGDFSMVVVGGSCQSVAGVGGCGGIALLDCGDQLPNNITFVFPPGLRPEHIAGIAAQEAAHAFGLSHTNDEQDIMFPVVQSVIPTAFGAGNVPDNPNCGSLFQDSNQLMLDTIGPRGPDAIAPSVAISWPPDGAIVIAESAVAAVVTDGSTTSVEFLVDGAMVSQASSRPHVFALPASAAGTVTIEVRATDSAGNASSASITAEISADGLEGNLGDSCADGSTCDSGFCAELDGERRCSRECNEIAACPDGFECLGGVSCWPDSGGGCLGCSQGDSPSPAGALLFLLLLALGGRKTARRS